MKFISLLLLLSLNLQATDIPKSTCYGATYRGKLKNGVKLPTSGRNFKTYSTLGSTLGRTYVHSKVYKIIMSSFKSLEKTHPQKVFMYGETGFEDGGKFKPHKTHQNGLSVDFMVPIIDKFGKSATLPTSWFNKLGYNIEFDSKGKYDTYKIDFEAIAIHLISLKKASRKQGTRIRKIYFDPKFTKRLLKTKYGSQLKGLNFSKKRAWVRHDEHYHVDFEIRCRKL